MFISFCMFVFLMVVMEAKFLLFYIMLLHAFILGISANFVVVAKISVKNCELTHMISRGMFSSLRMCMNYNFCVPCV